MLSARDCPTRSDELMPPSSRRRKPNHSGDIDTRRMAAARLLAEDCLRYPESLPITARRAEIVEAIRKHQIVIVAGETGSGKSTQLPKLCLEAGRGIAGLIGHTQPRRVAARSIATRVAEELDVTLGMEIGYTVRFNDQVSAATLVRVMTDGILLAELQRDRSLRRYDTLIIDEAHERSLNIDFLIGYLAQLLPSRPDLKVIVTSATIDTERFARHFTRDGAMVPIIEVEGRTFPVEVRYRPLDDGDEDRDQTQAICEAVIELSRDDPGDVLVFVSGEREIHDTADALRAADLRDTDIVPLYARLSSAEQQRIFAPHTRRRVVLSTNIAETSLTVPGVRCVVDAGNARISRYSRRLKVQRLPIEPISQASANQRAGRCGRVAPGICIRLYSEEDYAARPAFTEPEILRTNLASVILQMTAVGLGDVSAFPFLEAPDAAAIRDGYLLLEELGAIQDVEPGSPHHRASGSPRPAARLLTPIGKRLSRLPIDPRLGRMVLEAEQRNCVHDVMVIAAALSIQDPRERPQDKRQAADEMHRRFHVLGSDLLAFVTLWNYLREQQGALSSNQFRKLCRHEYLNYLRVREWQDLFSQLRRAAGDLGIRAGTEHGHPDHIHQSLLSGLLSHVGMREAETRTFRGARGAKFAIASASAIARKPPRWIMAAEMVETNQLWARRVGTIKPEWAEQLGAHLVKRSHGDPRWDATRGAVVTTETVILYGLPIVSGRVVAYDRVDAGEARSLFIRHALVEGDWRTHHTFMERNAVFVDRVRRMQTRVRRDDLLDDAVIEDFFDKRVDASVVSGRHFDTWWNRARRDQPEFLDFTDELVASHAGVRLTDFPDMWQVDGISLPVTYRYDPGGPFDGVNVHVPLVLLHQLTAEPFGWQIPGHRRALVDAVLRSLPKDVRRDLVPMQDTIDAVCDALRKPAGAFADALTDAVAAVAHIAVSPSLLDRARVPPHLRVHFIVADDDHHAVDADDDLDVLRRRQAKAMRSAIARILPMHERSGIVSWDVGTIAQIVQGQRDGSVVRGYPALLDDGDSVSLRIFTNATTQHRVMRAGVRRLLEIAVAPKRNVIARSIGAKQRTAMAGHAATFDQLVDACISVAVDHVLHDAVGLPWDGVAYDVLATNAQQCVPALATDALRGALDVLWATSTVRTKLRQLRSEAFRASVDDARQQLDRLTQDGFVHAAGAARIPDLLRYVKALDYRVDRLAQGVERDLRRMAEVRPLEQRYARIIATRPAWSLTQEIVDLRWALEELRVSVFAQPLGAKGTVSVTRIERELDALQT